MSIEDNILSRRDIILNEGFISYIKPELIDEGQIIWRGSNGNLMLLYDSSKFEHYIEKKEITNHYNERATIYRLGLVMIDRTNEVKELFKFYYKIF